MLPEPPDLLTELREKTLTRHPGVIGCPRRNRLDAAQSWRWARGNSLLALIGDKISIEAPFGVFDTFYRITTESEWLLQFRGGAHQPWWDEDALLLASTVIVYSNLNPAGVSTISELDGQLGVRYTGSPTVEEASRFATDALRRWQESRRIAKDSPRGKAICSYCPVRNPCLLLDLESGDTADWPVQPDLKLTANLLGRSK